MLIYQLIGTDGISRINSLNPRILEWKRTYRDTKMKTKPNLPVFDPPVSKLGTGLTWVGGSVELYL